MWPPSTANAHHGLIPWAICSNVHRWTTISSQRFEPRSFLLSYGRFRLNVTTTTSFRANVGQPMMVIRDAMTIHANKRLGRAGTGIYGRYRALTWVICHCLWHGYGDGHCLGGAIRHCEKKISTILLLINLINSKHIN